MKATQQIAFFISIVIAALPLPVSAADGLSLQISLTNGQTTFRLGEIISIDPVFVAAGPGTYQISGQDHRSMLQNGDHFHLTPTGRDPLHNYYANGAIAGSELMSSRQLGSTPFKLTEQLNEWLALDQPGAYTLYLTSDRVSRQQPDLRETLALQSNTVSFNVIAGDPAWQTAQWTKAVAILNDKARPPEQKAAALRVLRFLDTPESLRELARCLGKSGALQCWDCVAGLAGSRNEPLAVEELERQMGSPDVAITPGYLSTLTRLKLQLNYGTTNRSPSAEAWQEMAVALETEAVSLLPSKQGIARAETIQTLLLKHAALLPADEIIPAFKTLPADEQRSLLDFSWDLLKAPAMAVPLAAIVEQPTVPISGLRSIALRRLYELDPIPGRRLILEEITHPHLDPGGSLVSMRTLGLLPQFDNLLAARIQEKNRPSLFLDAQLIGRYATASILFQVKATYLPLAGRGACEIEDGFVLYFLRIEPGYGIQRLAASPHACMAQSLLAAVRMHRWQEVQPAVIALLNVPDRNLAHQAAETLARYGDAKAKQALWDRLRQFHEQWKDRARELDFSPDAMGVQYGIVESLGRAQAWLLSEAEIIELEKLTLGSETRTVAGWHNQSPVPLNLSFSSGSFAANIQQYSVQDIRSLRDKLTQFNRGTRFQLRTNGAGEELRQALQAVHQVAAARSLIMETAR